jgi:hypothetical protein
MRDLKKLVRVVDVTFFFVTSPFSQRKIRVVRKKMSAPPLPPPANQIVGEKRKRDEDSHTESNTVVAPTLRLQNVDSSRISGSASSALSLPTQPTPTPSSLILWGVGEITRMHGPENRQVYLFHDFNHYAPRPTQSAIPVGDFLLHAIQSQTNRFFDVFLELKTSELELYQKSTQIQPKIAGFSQHEFFIKDEWDKEYTSAILQARRTFIPFIPSRHDRAVRDAVTATGAATATTTSAAAASAASITSSSSSASVSASLPNARIHYIDHRDSGLIHSQLPTDDILFAFDVAEKSMEVKMRVCHEMIRLVEQSYSSIEGMRASIQELVSSSPRIVKELAQIEPSYQEKIIHALAHAYYNGYFYLPFIKMEKYPTIRASENRYRSLVAASGAVRRRQLLAKLQSLKLGLSSSKEATGVRLLTMNAILNLKNQDVFLCLMDVYCMARLLKPFKKTKESSQPMPPPLYASNAIIYAGAGHTLPYEYVLESLGFTTVGRVSYQGNDNWLRCQNKLKLPLFE